MSSFFGKLATVGLATLGSRRLSDTCTSDICAEITPGHHFAGEKIDSPCTVSACGLKLSKGNTDNPVVVLPANVEDYPCEACKGESKVTEGTYDLGADNHPDAGNIVESTVEDRLESVEHELYLPKDSHVPGFVNNRGSTKLVLSADNVLTVTAELGDEYKHKEHKCRLVGHLQVQDDDHTSSTFKTNVPCSTCQDGKSTSIPSKLEDAGNGDATKSFEISFNLKELKRRELDNKELSYYDRKSIGKLRIDSNYELICKDPSNGLGEKRYALQTSSEQGRRLGRKLVDAQNIPLDYNIKFETAGKCAYDTVTTSLELPDPVYHSKKHQEYLTTFSPKSVIKFTNIRYPQNEFGDFTTDYCQPQGESFKLKCEWADTKQKDIMDDFSAWFDKNDADVASDSPASGVHEQTYGKPTEPTNCPNDVCTSLGATADAPFTAKLGFEVPLTKTYYKAKPRMVCTDAADVPTVEDEDSGAPTDRAAAESAGLYLQKELVVSYSAEPITQDTVVKQRFKSDFGDAYCADTDDCEADDSKPIAKVFQASKGESAAFSRQKVTLLQPVAVIKDFIDLTADKYTRYGKTSWSCVELLHVSKESEADCKGLVDTAENTDSITDFNDPTATLIGTAFSTAPDAVSTLQGSYDAWTASTHVHVPQDYEIEFYDYKIALVDRDGGALSAAVEVDRDIRFRERSSSVRLALTVSSDGTQLMWGGSAASESTEFEGENEAWESPDESVDGKGNNRGLFLVDTCRFCNSDYAAVQFDKYVAATESYAYHTSTGYDFFTVAPTDESNFNKGAAHISSVCAQKAGETGYDDSSVMCHSKTRKAGSGSDLIFLDDHAYDCLDATHKIKVSLRKSTGDDRVKEEYVEVFKTYPRPALMKYQASGVDYEPPVAEDIDVVLNVEVGTQFDDDFSLPHPVTQAGEEAKGLEFSPTKHKSIGYTCGSSTADTQNEEYTKDYFHPCTDAAIAMKFVRPVRGLYSERQAQRKVSGGDDWEIREYDLERGGKTFKFQVAAPYTHKGVDTPLTPVVTFNHGGSSPSQAAVCEPNDDRTQTCTITLSKQAIDTKHQLGVNEECGSGHAVECPTIEIELKTGITTPFSADGHELAISGNKKTAAFWDEDSGGVCGDDDILVKLPITAKFARKKTYTLKVTGNDNSYDQIITVSTRHNPMDDDTLKPGPLARYVVHHDEDAQEFDATGEHDALDTLMEKTGQLPVRGNEYAHLRIEFTKDDAETQYKIDVLESDEVDAFVCSQQAFTSECVDAGTSRTITLARLTSTHLFVGVRKKKGIEHASDVCENRLAGEDAFALGDNDHHFAFTIQKVGGDAQPHKYRVPMVCPSNGYDSDARITPTLESFGGLRPSAASPAHRQVKNAKISGFVAEYYTELSANDVKLKYERLPDGSITYSVKDIYQEQMKGACTSGKFAVNFAMGSAVFATEDVACTDEEFGILRTVVGIGADAQILEEGGLVPNHLLATDGAEFSLAVQIVGDDDFKSECEGGAMWVEQGIGAPGFVSSPASAFQRAGASECADIPLTKFKLHADERGERCRFALITLSEPSASAAVPRFVKFRVQCPRVDDADESRLTDKLQLNYGIESALLGADSLQIELAPRGIGVRDVTARFGNELEVPCNTRVSMKSEGVCNLDAAIGSNHAISGSTSDLLQSIVNCGGTFSEQDSGGKKQLAVNVDVQRQQARDAGVFGQKFYCGLAKLAFVYETTATTSTVITVKNPKDKIFAVGIDDLKYEKCGGDSDGYRLAATILVQHGDDVDSLGPAGAEVQRGAVTKFGWAGEDDKPALTDIDDGAFKIEGACQPPPDDDSCPAYENTRMIGFSLSMRVNEVVYTGRAALEMRLDCPINQDVALDGEEDDAVKSFTDKQLTTRVVCPESGEPLDSSKDECADSTQIAADSNILIVAAPTDAEAAMFDHTFEEPTIDIGNTDPSNPSAPVKVSTLTDEFRAVVEGGAKKDFTSEDNTELRLRALPLAGTSAVITWTVTRDAPKRRARQLLTISYTLGADGSVEKSTKIGVLPAVRTSQQDSSVTYTEERTVSYPDGRPDSKQNVTYTTDKPSEVTAGMSTVAIILAAVAATGAVVAVILAITCNKQATGAGGAPAVALAGYAAIPTMDWSRDRFKPDFL